MLSKILSAIFFIYILTYQACERAKIPFVDINTSTKYHFGDTLTLTKNYNFGLKVNGWPQKPGSEKFIDSSFYTIGDNTLEFSYEIDGKAKTAKRQIVVYPSVPPKKLNFRIVKNYKHGTDIYTEGLEEYKGDIYESAGEYKKSKLLKYHKTNLANSKEYIHDNNIFAEGITILNDTLYGLTYREHKIFRFNPENLELIDVKSTPIDFEGWGLTNDGKSLIMSDGTNNIYYLSPKDYSIKKILQVYNNSGKQTYLNELEYVDGIIYANIFTTDIVVGIDANSGAVLYNLDFTKISSKHKKQGVLNGIAKIKNGNFLFTGKHWDKTYEVKIDKID